MIGETLVAVIAQLKWPVLALVTLVLFRAPIREFLSRLTNLSVSAGDFKVETALKGRVSPEALSEIRKRPELLQIKSASHHQVSILQIQTRGFTVLSETMSPEKVASYLQTYLTRMTAVVFEFGGTIDRYEGTTLTAYWGAPITYPDSATRACRAALRMHALIKEISPELEAQGFPPLLPLCAITTADVIAGNLGSEQRPSYTILGDYTDILHGLTGLNQNFRTNILITEYTLEQVGDEFEVRLLGEKLRTKGKEQLVSVYELCGAKT